MPIIAKRSKRYKKREKLVDREKRYALADAVKVLKKIETGKFIAKINVFY